MLQLSERLAVTLLISLVLGALVYIGKEDSNIEAETDRRYCEMTKLYQDTNGEQGWPKYKEMECVYGSF